MEIPKKPRGVYDKISSLLNSKTNKRDFIWVSALYVLGVAIHYFKGIFPKVICIYKDEFLYYTIAHSLHDGAGISCMNGGTDFGKVLYSLVISPFFGIDDAVLRVRMITLFNSALIFSSLFLVYLIAKELEFNRRSMILAMLIAFAWPEFLYSVSFMAENLNWPLSLLAIYLWIRGKRAKKAWAYSIAFGALCYMGYLCKDIFLALFLSYILFELFYPFFMYLRNRERNRESDSSKKFWEYYNKRSLIGCAISFGVFAVCYAAGSLLMYGGNNANPVGTAVGGLSNLKDEYAFYYLFYAFANYLCASVIAVLVLPIFYSAGGFGYLDKKTQSLFSFLLIYLIVSCGMVAYTVSIHEEIGRTQLRMNLRYVGFILLLFTVLFFKVLQESKEIDKKTKRKQFGFAAAGTLIVSAVFKGFRYVSPVDQTLLYPYMTAANKMGPISNDKGDKIFYRAVLAVFIGLILISLIVHLCNKKSNRTAAYAFFVIMLLICRRNDEIGMMEYKLHYSIDEKIISDVLPLNDYLKENNGSNRVLYICSYNRSEYFSAITVYFNYNADFCCAENELIHSLTDDKGIVEVPNADFVLTVKAAPYPYDRLSGFDYIITDCENDTDFNGVSLIDRASSDSFKLYKNDNPETVEIAL